MAIAGDGLALPSKCKYLRSIYLERYRVKILWSKQDGTEYLFTTQVSIGENDPITDVADKAEEELYKKHGEDVDVVMEIEEEPI